MSDAPDTNDSRTIAAVDKCCAILDSTHELQGATLTEISEHVGLTPGTVHPHLATLLENQLVTKTDGVYAPSFKFLRVGERRRRENVFFRHATNKIEELAQRINARVQIYVEEFGMGVCIAQTGSHGSIQPPDRVGDQTHLHVIAAGKAMLAEMPDERVSEIVAQHGMPEYTSNTIVEESDLFDALEDISDRGYACNDEEYMSGLGAVGSAVTAKNGDVIGAISAAVPTNRMETSEFADSVPLDVASVANTIELDIQVEKSE
ncbi:IclR family transcriptional regulator [Halobaculum rubrum]|uniref:IclR family transcriptional regulator n=1 Tax=Halobaculum rubrum TaxID=2872158 RepID=UPI001CA3BA71|nr:IclR family transcriptional regulator [Halobaculum rubrum]QZX99244.1 IclR family transcriptional regulator [Halobaculum rubrum]